MKKLGIIGLALVSLMFVSCKENASKKIESANLENAKERDEKNSLGSPVIEFDTTEYDFGTITEGEEVSGAFKITNTGKSNLIITSVKPSCGCTTPEWTKEAIPPGGNGEIKFVFNSKNRVGKQNKSITIKSNAEKIVQMVRLKGVVNKKS